MNYFKINILYSHIKNNRVTYVKKENNKSKNQSSLQTLIKNKGSI